MATADEAGPTTGKPACAVTFGRSTLLGRHLADALAASGRWSAVAVLDPSPSPPPTSPLVRHHAVDLSDPAGLASALAGAAAVFHVDATTATAAAPGSDGSFLSLHRLAAEGTRRLLEACRAAGVERVVYTGSADVVAAGARDVVNADEDSASYPDKFGNAVSELRAQVEMMVLGADGVDGMRTCVLRPSNMFGPGDSSLLRFVAGYARSPLGKFVIGGGSNMSDFTYVENVAHANICAEQALCSNATSVAGKPFFVTNDEPMETWEFMNCIMEAMGCPRPRINLPTKMLLSVALFSNMIRNRLGFQMFSTPLLHPDTIYFLSCTRTFNTSKARKLLGYYPIVSLEDGIMRTVGSFSELSDNLGFLRKQRSCGSSKADKLLGSGTGDTDPFSLEKIALWCFCFPPNWMNKNLVTKISCCSCAELFSFLLKYQTLHCDLYMFPLLTCYVSTAAADILLWRDEKRTFSFVIVLFLLFYWFLLSDRTFVSSAAKFLLVTSLTLFIHGVLPSQVFGFTVEKVTSDHFEVSHSALRNSLMCLASAWNGSIQKLRVLAEGEDWSTLLKVFAFLYSVKLLLNFQFRVLMGLVLASLFIVFIVYEQCEEEIDSLVSYASVKIKWLMDRVVELLPTSVKAYIS